MIHESVQIGRYAVIEEGVSIGAGSVIGHHAVIHAGSILGEGVRVDDFACIGKKPSRAANSAVTSEDPLPPCVIGAYCILGTHTVIYRGATLGERCLAADYAVVREDVFVGEGSILGKGVTIENHSRIGCWTKIQTNAYITAYSEIGNHCFIAPGVVTSNDNFAGRSPERFRHFKGVTVRDGGRIGAGAVILPGKTIGEDGFAAAGSVVTRDIPPGMIAAGNPARLLKEVPADQLLSAQEKLGF